VVIRYCTARQPHGCGGCNVPSALRSVNPKPRRNHGIATVRPVLTFAPVLQSDTNASAGTPPAGRALSKSTRNEEEELTMRLRDKTLMAIGAAAAVALAATAADAHGWRGSGYGGAYGAYTGGTYDAYAAPYAGAYAYAPGPYAYAPGDSGSYYAYGANRSNPSLAPNGWDPDNPRDFQLGGHN
jgi:hypothetical protein